MIHSLKLASPPLIIYPQSFAELQELRHCKTEFIELGEACFTPAVFTFSPPLRGYIISRLTTEGDIAGMHSAFWIHTGISTPALARELNISRQDEKRRRPQSRRRFPAAHIERIGGQLLTTKERTAIDLLRVDLIAGSEKISALLEAGSSLEAIYACSKEIRGATGIRQARKAVAQFIESGVYKNLESKSDSRTK
ncbi:hypothetical protein [uncultured Arcanobacterium sp.]|uniref:hypothetical protein n=1 Tax=uncultured Arcanobacterium sp. TaxID=487520 RepID=UPI002633B0B6|nr:hypothetical protein [uncultured Arcanobacterium sp.]